MPGGGSVARTVARPAARAAGSAASRPPARKAARAAYHHGDLRRALLDAARATLREQGPEALSLREVARRAGVSHAAPYHHFSAREALLGAVAAEAYAEMDRAMAEAQAAAPEAPTAQLVAVGMGYLLFALREPAAFRLMTRPEYAAPPAGSEVAGEGPYGRLQRALQRLTGRPATETDLHLCWAAVHGLALLALDGALGPAPAAAPAAAAASRAGLAAHARQVIERLAAGLVPTVR
jgi:AcrR family transcriptional regulator